MPNPQLRLGSASNSGSHNVQADRCRYADLSLSTVHPVVGSHHIHNGNVALFIQFPDLCFAAAALLFGIGLFKGIRTFPAATKASAAFILLGAILSISPYVGRFVLIDKCLDRGGSWNHRTIQCSDE